MERDAIDFGTMHIPRLFVKLFVPTLLGMMFGAALNLADGIFVGQGVGSDALAAINIAAPVFLAATGLALLFGSGVSVVSAIHLSHGNVKAASINVTQAFTVSSALMGLVCLLVYAFPRQTAYLFGGSDQLMPLVLDYLLWVMPGIVGCMLTMIGMFVIRLDGSPRYAMYAEIIPSVINIVLDYVLVFPAHMGVKGAAVATSISQLLGAAMVLFYLLKRRQTLYLYRPKFSRKSIRLTMRNVGYMSRLGFSNFIGEAAMAAMMVTGNYMFIGRLHEDGVAAFSVACYMFPLVFMFGSAIAQSSLPIVSYNHGQGNEGRIRATFRLSMVLAIVFGLLISILGVWFCRPLLHLFLSGSHAYVLAEHGFPMFATSFVFFTLNIVLIGYYQSVERASEAIVFMLLRGFVLMIPCFVLLPHFLGDDGLWWAVPLSEGVTFFIILIYGLYRFSSHWGHGK